MDGKSWTSNATLWLAASASAALLASCAADLGSCDMTALGGSAVPGMAAPTNGQVVVQSNCASGHCHTVSATGVNRVGAPAGLNFDVVPNDTSQPEIDKISRGAKTVRDYAHDMWGEVDSGFMPPKGNPALAAADKQTLRNWLACGAPVIATPATSAADWNSIYKSLAPMCTVCHGTASAVGSGNGFLLGDADATNPVNVCAAYKNVLGKMSVTTMGMCATMNLTLVVPGQPDSSLLLRKIEGTQPCGVGMPYGAPLGPTNPISVALRQWIMAGAQPPAGCM